MFYALSGVGQHQESIQIEGDPLLGKLSVAPYFAAPRRLQLRKPWEKTAFLPIRMEYALIMA